MAELLPRTTEPSASTSTYFTSWHTVRYEIMPMSTTFSQISAISNWFSGHYCHQNDQKLKVHCFFHDSLDLMNINPATSTLYRSPIIIKWTLTSELVKFSPRNKNPKVTVWRHRQEPTKMTHHFYFSLRKHKKWCKTCLKWAEICILSASRDSKNGELAFHRTWNYVPDGNSRFWQWNGDDGVFLLLVYQKCKFTGEYNRHL